MQLLSSVKFHSRYVFSTCLLIVFFSLSAFAQNQSGDVTVGLRLDPILTKSQTLSIAALGVDAQGKGARVLDLVIENRVNQVVENLYLHVSVSSSNHGVLSTIDQRNGRPFSLSPNQIIFANNNQLESGIPGINPPIQISGGLTPEGDKFLNELEGSTSLPDAIYTVLIEIYQGANKPSGGTRLASFTESIGGRPIQNLVDFFLLQPGGPLGSNERIVNRQPVFRWDGPPGISYRLIVVEDIGQTAESLIQSAYSTPPTSGGTTSGTLLEFEKTDVVINSNNYFYPAAGAKQLEQGKRFFWQVFGRVQTGGAIDERPSSIYEFTLSSPDASSFAEFMNEIIPILQSFNPEVSSTVTTLKETGYLLESISVDGQIYSGSAIISILSGIREKIENGNIVIVNQ